MPPGGNPYPRVGRDALTRPRQVDYAARACSNSIGGGKRAVDDERLVAALAKRAFAADLGCPPEEVDAVLNDQRLSMVAAAIGELLERRWAPIVRAVLEGLREAETGAAGDKPAPAGRGPGDVGAIQAFP